MSQEKELSVEELEEKVKEFWKEYDKNKAETQLPKNELKAKVIDLLKEARGRIGYHTSPKQRILGIIYSPW